MGIVSGTIYVTPTPGAIMQLNNLIWLPYLSPLACFSAGRDPLQRVRQGEEASVLSVTRLACVAFGRVGKRPEADALKRVPTKRYLYPDSIVKVHNVAPSWNTTRQKEKVKVS